jgi:hypothetical protein
MELSNSKMKALMSCESKFYHTFVAKDYIEPPSEAMSCGSLLDAIITKGVTIDPDGRPNPLMLKEAMASTYGDGSEHVNNVLVKSGALTAEARRVAKAGLRLLADPVVQKLLKKAESQKTVKGEFLGMQFSGTPDLVTELDGTSIILDVKKTTSAAETWAEVYQRDGTVRNEKMAWFEAWDYWMQLCLYKHLCKLPDARTGLLSASNEEIARISLDMIKTDIKQLERIWEPYITRIKHLETFGWNDLKRCGECAYCRMTAKIEIGDDIPARLRYL